MRSTDRSFRRLVVLIAALLGLGMLAPAAGAAPLADVPGTPCQQGGWVWMAPADTPDIAFLSEEACASAIAQGIRIVPITIPPDGPPPIGAGICISDDCFTVDRDSDGAPDFRDAAPDDPNVTISADCTRVMADRTVTNFANLNLASCDLRERHLTGANFSGANLAGANLTNAYLADANLTGANLAGANLHHAVLNGADLTRAKVMRADLTWSILIGATLYGTNLSGANLSNAMLSGADMTRAYLPGANLTDAAMVGANLTEANLERVNLRGANLREATLTGATLWEAIGDYRTVLTDAYWQNTTCPRGAVATFGNWNLCLGDFELMSLCTNPRFTPQEYCREFGL